MHVCSALSSIEVSCSHSRGLFWYVSYRKLTCTPTVAWSMEKKITKSSFQTSLGSFSWLALVLKRKYTLHFLFFCAFFFGWPDDSGNSHSLALIAFAWLERNKFAGESKVHTWLRYTDYARKNRTFVIWQFRTIRIFKLVYKYHILMVRVSHQCLWCVNNS